MASLGTNSKVEPGPNFKIQGKLYHLIGSLLPDPGTEPKFAQLYFFNTEDETKQRLSHTKNGDPEIIEFLQNMLKNINNYIKSFQSVVDMGEIGEMKLTLLADKSKIPSTAHERTYNLPDGNEVAVLLPGEPGNMDVILRKRGGGLIRINGVHRSYDPLHYVLLFPFGDDGFCLGLQRQSGRTLSAKDYYNFHLQERENHSDHLHFGRLTQQYIVDQQAKIEAARMQWVNSNQATIRAEKYKGLMDATSSEETNVGKKVILPPTILGSPRWYMEEFQNGMALVRLAGKPDIFVTMTCNIMWPEIQVKCSHFMVICAELFNNISIFSLHCYLEKQHLTDQTFVQEFLNKKTTYYFIC